MIRKISYGTVLFHAPGSRARYVTALEDVVNPRALLEDENLLYQSNDNLIGLCIINISNQIRTIGNRTVIPGYSVIVLEVDYFHETFVVSVPKVFQNTLVSGAASYLTYPVDIDINSFDENWIIGDYLLCVAENAISILGHASIKGDFFVITSLFPPRIMLRGSMLGRQPSTNGALVIDPGV